jgi:hypothetical protein
MALEGTDPTIPLALVAVVGGTVAFFGYDLVDALLPWAGGAAGAFAVGALVWASPAFTDGIELQYRYIFVGLLGFAGGLTGFFVVPVATRAATVGIGFVVATITTFVVVTGQRVVTADELADAGTTGQPQTILEALQFETILQDPQLQQIAAIALVAGAVAAVFAWRYYVLLMALVTSAAGATILGYVVPLWQQRAAFDGLTALTGSAFSTTWFVAVFVVGFAVQYVRHADVFDDTPNRPEPLR